MALSFDSISGIVYVAKAAGSVTGVKLSTNVVSKTSPAQERPL